MRGPCLGMTTKTGVPPHPGGMSWVQHGADCGFHSTHRPSLTGRACFLAVMTPLCVCPAGCVAAWHRLTEAVPAGNLRAAGLRQPTQYQVRPKGGNRRSSAQGVGHVWAAT